MRLRKLVRDKIPRLMLEEGLEPNVRILVGEELDTALRTKLREEASEVARARSREELIEEIADVAAVAYALRKHHDISSQEMQDATRLKSSQKGSFCQGFEVDVPASAAGPIATSAMLLDADGNDAMLLPFRRGEWLTGDPAAKHVGLVDSVRYYYSNGKSTVVPLLVPKSIEVGDTMNVKEPELS